MKPTTLRRRLYTLLFRWPVLFLLLAAIIMGLAFARFRAVAMDERMVISRTLARSLDSSITGLFQNLQHLASGNPATGRADSDDRFLERLRAGRSSAAARRSPACCASGRPGPPTSLSSSPSGATAGATPWSRRCTSRARP